MMKTNFSISDSECLYLNNPKILSYVYKLKRKKKSIQVKSEMYSGCKLLNGVSSRGELCSINFFFISGSS